jgi:sec-independent protein translocase protein TatA
MPNIGPWEVVILVVILLLIFGSRKLPDIGRSLGKGMREFKDAVTGKDDKREASPPREPAELRGRAVEEDEQPVATVSSGQRERDDSS